MLSLPRTVASDNGSSHFTTRNASGSAFGEKSLPKERASLEILARAIIEGALFMILKYCILLFLDMSRFVPISTGGESRRVQSPPCRSGEHLILC